MRVFTGAATGPLSEHLGTCKTLWHTRAAFGVPPSQRLLALGLSPSVTLRGLTLSLISAQSAVLHLLGIRTK